MARTKKTLEKVQDMIADTPKSVVIEQPKVMSVAMEITGTQPLIMNAFSQKAIEQMLRKHMGLNVQRETKKPRECIEQATIRNEAGAICVPPQGIKAAMISASAAVKGGMKKTQLRTQIFIEGGSVPITFEKQEARMDMVRTSGMGRTPDVRFRPMFSGWKARLRILFSDTISVQSVVDLLNRAGKVGLGEWRPEKNGTFGTFYVSRHIGDPKEVAEVVDVCAPALVKPVIPEWAMDADLSPEMLKKIAGGATGENGAHGEPDAEEEEESDEEDAHAN